MLRVAERQGRNEMNDSTARTSKNPNGAPAGYKASLSSRSAGQKEAREANEILGQRCDFCGDRVSSVRRVALDHEYDRLQKAHNEQYSCADCFEKKEQERMGLARR